MGKRIGFAYILCLQVCRLVGVYPDQPEAGLCRYQGGAELAPAKLLPSEYSNGVESGPDQASEPAGLLLARLPARPGLRTGQDSAV